MTERNKGQAKKLIRDLEALDASIREDWADLDSTGATMDERADMKKRLSWCIDEMKQLADRLA